MTWTSTIIASMPNLNSLTGMIFYGVIAYLITMIFTIGVSSLIAHQVDIEGSLRRSIIKQREKEQQRHRLVKLAIKNTSPIQLNIEQCEDKQKVI